MQSEKFSSRPRPETDKGRILAALVSAIAPLDESGAEDVRVSASYGIATYTLSRAIRLPRGYPRD